jgi:hypothetical protein
MLPASTMKTFKYIATLTLAIAGLTAHVDAIPITYSYTGNNFTSGTGQSGFSINDNITASFTVNNPLAPNMTFNLTSIGATMATISNGVFTLPFLGGLVTTNAFGSIVEWAFGVDQLQPDLSIVRLESVNFGGIGTEDDAHQFFLDESSFDASNGVPGTWSSGPATVPDEGATLALLGLAFTGAEALRRKVKDA